MKVLLKTTTVLFALMCIVGISNACDHKFISPVIEDLRKLDQAMGSDLASSLESADKAHRVNHGNLEMIHDFLKSQLSLEERFDNVAQLISEINTNLEPRASQTAATSSSSSPAWINDLYAWTDNIRELLTTDMQRRLLQRSLDSLRELPDAQIRDIFEEMSRSEVTKHNIDDVIDELYARIETLRPIAPQSLPEGFQRFTNLVLPRGTRLKKTMTYDSFMQRFIGQFNRNGIRVLNEGKRQGQEVGLSDDQIRTAFEARTANLGAWSRVIEKEVVFFDSNKEEELNIFMNCLTPLFLDHDPIEILHMTGWYG